MKKSEKVLSADTSANSSDGRRDFYAATPRPWSVYRGDRTDRYPGIDGGCETVVIFGREGEQCGVRGETPSAARANAELIVRSVNFHDDLTTSLKDVLRILDAVKLSAGLGKKQIERVEAAKKILAQAEAA